MKAFTVREDNNLKNYIIGLDEDFFAHYPKVIMPFSYSNLAARLLGFSYADYIRYCVVNGGVIRKVDNFIYVVFPSKAKAEKICTIINTNWTNYVNYMTSKGLGYFIYGDEK